MAPTAMFDELPSFDQQYAGLLALMWPLVNLLDDAVVVVGADGLVRAANRMVEEVFAHPPDSLVGRPLEVLIPEEARDRHHAQFVRFGDSGDAHRRMSQRSEVTGRRADGRTFPARVSIMRIDAEETLYVALVRDLSERSALESEIGRLSSNDPSTGLLTRDAFVREVDGWLQAGGEPGSIVCVEIKGREALDQIDLGTDAVTAVSRRLGRLKGSDQGGICARLGDSSFAIHLPSATDRRALDGWIRHLLNSLCRPITSAARPLRVAITIGARRCDPTVDVARLLADAQLALGHARRDTRSPFAVYEPAMGARAAASAELIGDLAVATRGEMWVAYQPIVSTATGRPCAAEALLRWNHPRCGAVSPETFIPLAEESGAIHEIGRWTIDTVCDQLAEWDGTDWFGEDFVVAVNVSARQLEGPALIGDLARALARTGVAPERLRLELTESQAMHDVDSGIELLAEIAELGIAIGMDDFGTGYSSLAQLGRLPIDEIKLDRSFVARMIDEAAAMAIIDAVLTIGNAFGVDVVAEGVETEEQLRMLAEMGCPLAQGWHFAPPVPAHEFAEIVRRLRSPER